jgi:hypothetical protein
MEEIGADVIVLDGGREGVVGNGGGRRYAAPWRTCPKILPDGAGNDAGADLRPLAHLVENSPGRKPETVQAQIRGPWRIWWKIAAGCAEAFRNIHPRGGIGLNPPISWGPKEI